MPLLWSVSDKVTCGVFWQNASETWVDLDYNPLTCSNSAGSKHKLNTVTSHDKVTTYWCSESGIIDVTLILQKTPQQSLKEYLSLTGK